MAIGKASKARPTASPSLAGSSTGYVSIRPPDESPQVRMPVPGDTKDTLPSYDEQNEDAIPDRLVLPSSDNDLDYFGAMAAGRPASTPPYSTSLVLNFYRATQTHLSPVEERLSLGSTSRIPFYALRASSGLNSVDEYNKLTLTRRQPSSGIWEHACHSEIFPRLKLLAKENMRISRIHLPNDPDVYDMIWSHEREMYIITKNFVPLLTVELEGWGSLDSKPSKGYLTVMLVGEYSFERLATLDFNKSPAQLYCSTSIAHRMLDLIVLSLLNVATVHSRKFKLLSQQLVSMGLEHMNLTTSTIVYARQRANIVVIV